MPRPRRDKMRRRNSRAESNDARRSDGGKHERSGRDVSRADEAHRAAHFRNARLPHENKRDANSTSFVAARANAAIARCGALRQLLEGIGAPAPAPFAPDAFQLEALSALEYEDVLVTAPTGSGKTWIAREEIRRLLKDGRRAWYTSPLKALTNSKYQEFIEEFGAERVGILTGDRKENSNAPLIVGTTEIYRNQLFDSLREGRETNADLVIMDEAHYLADEERGHVWEEAIILTPPRVRLLLLSATIGRADEFAAWIEEVRGVRCGVVAREAEQGNARPVPLRAAFLFPEGELAPLFDERGRFNHEIARLQQSTQQSARRNNSRFNNSRSNDDESRRRKLHMPEMPPAVLLTALGSYDLLPAIVFLPTRRRCDEAASEAALTPFRRGETSAQRQHAIEARREMLKEIVARHPEIRRHRHYEMLVRGGVAAHHAGHLPAWKLAIERLMSAGLLDAIFATATVAAGVDFPARTVVLQGVEVRTGRGWRSLTASEVQQMTGRAGRRGRDRVGFVVAAPGMHQDPQRLAALLKAPPDPLESHFRATYTTLLNLLDAYKSFAQVREIVERSFAFRDTLARIIELEAERERQIKNLNSTLAASGLDLTANDARGLERLASARERILESAPQTRAENLARWLDEHATPGRIVTIGRSAKRLVLVTERRASSIVGVREDGRRASFTIDRIGRIYERFFPYATKNERAEAFQSVRAGEARFLPEPRLRGARAATDDAVDLVNDLIEKFTVKTGDESDSSRAEVLWSTLEQASEIERIERDIAALRDEVWQPFLNRARILAHFGYLDLATERVTERGRWLADLRVDRPLLVGEALARRLFDSLDAERAAALVAALASDSERDYGELELPDALISTLAQFERIAFEVSSVEWQHTIEPAPEINFSAAAAAAHWSKQSPQQTKWGELVRDTRAEEGDLFRMLSRTGESLLQIAALEETHPQAARIAAHAAEQILREPVRYD